MMINFSKIKVGSCTIEHLSTASVINLEFSGIDGGEEACLDYNEFADLCKAIDKIKEGWVD